MKQWTKKAESRVKKWINEETKNKYHVDFFKDRNGKLHAVINENSNKKKININIQAIVTDTNYEKYGIQIIPWEKYTDIYNLVVTIEETNIEMIFYEPSKAKTIIHAIPPRQLKEIKKKIKNWIDDKTKFSVEFKKNQGQTHAILKWTLKERPNKDPMERLQKTKKQYGILKMTTSKEHKAIYILKIAVEKRVYHILLYEKLNRDKAKKMVKEWIYKETKNKFHVEFFKENNQMNAILLKNYRTLQKPFIEEFIKTKSHEKYGINITPLKEKKQYQLEVSQGLETYTMVFYERSEKANNTIKEKISIIKNCVNSESSGLFYVNIFCREEKVHAVLKRSSKPMYNIKSLIHSKSLKEQGIKVIPTPNEEDCYNLEVPLDKGSFSMMLYRQNSNFENFRLQKYMYQQLIHIEIEFSNQEEKNDQQRKKQTKKKLKKWFKKEACKVTFVNFKLLTMTSHLEVYLIDKQRDLLNKLVNSNVYDVKENLMDENPPLLKLNDKTTNVDVDVLCQEPTIKPFPLLAILSKRRLYRKLNQLVKMWAKKQSIFGAPYLTGYLIAVMVVYFTLDGCQIKRGCGELFCQFIDWFETKMNKNIEFISKDQPIRRFTLSNYKEWIIEDAFENKMNVKSEQVDIIYQKFKHTKHILSNAKKYQVSKLFK